MTHAREMLDTHPGSAAMDAAALVKCIAVCFDCAQPLARRRLPRRARG